MRKGEIWQIELPCTNGHEQAGLRPALIMADTDANVAIVIPFTTNPQALRFAHTFEIRPSAINGLRAVSVGLLFQLRAIDKKRVRRRIGILEDHMMEKVNVMARTMLAL